MKLQELQSKINTISLGSNHHSPLNTQKLEELFTDKRKILCEKENGIRRQFKNGDDRDKNARLEFVVKMKQAKLKKQIDGRKTNSNE